MMDERTYRGKSFLIQDGIFLQVLKHLEDLSEFEDYLRFVGRLHDVAGVDPRFLDVTGLAFCHALDQLVKSRTTWANYLI